MSFLHCVRLPEGWTPAPGFGPLLSADATRPAGHLADPPIAIALRCSTPGSAGAEARGWSPFLASSNQKKRNDNMKYYENNEMLRSCHKTRGTASCLWPINNTGNAPIHPFSIKA